MDAFSKVQILSDILKQDIIPAIEQDYVLYGLPYYSNIGDTLIWEGELELLKNTPHKCKSVCGWNHYPKRVLPPNLCMLIQGGGYCGDVWRNAWEYVLNEISMNLDRRIIVLPVSVWYNDPVLLEKDRALLSRARHLTLFVRDQQSYDFAIQHFDNDIRLVPDMAYAINPSSLQQWCLPTSKDCLYLKRIDKEFIASDATIPPTAETKDWPTFDDYSTPEKFVYQVESYYRHFKGKPILSSLFKAITDESYYRIYRKQMLSRGVQFISQYQTIYTTRLHGMILATLLGKQTFYLDNSYGKVSSFYQTWLSDVDNINPADYE